MSGNGNLKGQRSLKGLNGQGNRPVLYRILHAKRTPSAGVMWHQANTCTTESVEREEGYNIRLTYYVCGFRPRGIALVDLFAQVNSSASRNSHLCYLRIGAGYTRMGIRVVDRETKKVVLYIARQVEY